MVLHAKMVLTVNVEEIVVLYFIGLETLILINSMILCSRNTQVTCRETTNEKNQFSKLETLLSNSLEFSQKTNLVIVNISSPFIF